MDKKTDTSSKPSPKADILSLCMNLPGPLAIKELVGLGYTALKIEPSSGDPLHHACPKWYQELHHCVQVLPALLHKNLLWKILGSSQARFFLTSSRPQFFLRMNLSWKELHQDFPHLHWIQIVCDSKNPNFPGHDLNAQASLGFLSPPELPPFLLADYLSSQEIVKTVLNLSQQSNGKFHQISIQSSLQKLQETYSYGLTKKKGILGGSDPFYQLYQTKDHWIALAALEPRFQNNLHQMLQAGEKKLCKHSLQEHFSTQTTNYWLEQGKKFDIPISEVKELP